MSHSAMDRRWWRGVLSRWKRGAQRPRARNQYSLAIELLESRLLLSGSPIISEFLASNSGGLQDADGDSSDWIEIYNPTATAIDLAGWSLTDATGDLNEWQFPDVSIGANQFLTVFASGKDRKTGPELHTNFKLSADGEFLALVDPSNRIVSQFNPKFPSQASNISYGVEFDTAQFIKPGASAQVLVPTDGSLGDTWTSPTYIASGWTTGTTGIGYGVVQPGFNVTYIKANTFVDNLDVARNVIADTSLRSQTVSSSATVVNFMGNGGGGYFDSDLAFPTQSVGDDIDDFVVEADGSVKIPSAGNWTFGVNSDDGFSLRLEKDGVVFTSEFFNPRAPGDTFATFNIPEAGDWKIQLIMYERGGGASVELFAAQGTYQSIGDATFHLVGDTTGGGLAVYSTINAGSSVVVGTDVGPAMQNVNASAYVRIPFTVADATAFDSLLLKMRYDDGFVAYLNGIEVARRNAPGTLAFDSAATADRTLLDATTPETINLTPFLNLLQPGNNVLAIQGLNSSAGDDSFLLLPELTASAVHPDQLRYFATVTPGDPNIDPALGVIERVSASVGAGFYDAPISVSLATPSAGAEIRYTIDGSTPTATNGFVYNGSIAISSTTTLRAGAFRAGYVSLPTITRTYIFLDDVINQSPSDDVDGGAPDVGQAPPGWPASWGNNVVDYGIDQTVVQQEGADRVKAALLAIPSISITTDLANLFDPSIGIYANAYNDGRDWERPASVELLNPDGTPGFQVNAGLRIRGGYSRSGDNPKHAFRLFFRGEYGDSTLDYPLFGSEGVDSFKKMDLRTAQNYSWSFGGDPSNTMIQDVFERESQGAMGEPYTRSRWYHLYIDGQYWGVFQTQERAEAEYAASYFGGTAANYDVVKPETGPYTIYATDGNLDAYHRLWQFVTTQNMADNANYFRLQGMDVGGTQDPSIPNEDVLLDVDNLVVYMIGILHSGNLDAPISAFLGNQGVNNFFAVRDRTGRTGFQYFQHDGEHTLHNINEDRFGPFPAGQDFDRFNPQFLHQQLMANAEYRQKFADAVEKYFFNDGAMTVTNSLERFQKHADALDQAIIGESARWGDSKRPTSPLGRSDWLNAVNAMLSFLENRNDVFLQQLRNYGLFPNLPAPQFLVNGAYQHDGEVDPGSQLRFAASGGLVYYTLDGSDPRLVGGGLNPAALIYDPAATAATVLAAGSTWKYNDQGTDLGTGWRASSYDDSAWPSGPAELGYGEGDEATTINYGADPSNKFRTSYFRSTFSVADTSAITGLTLRLKRDDGAVVYVNGVEAVRSNMPTGTITAETLATASVGGSDEQTFYEYQIDPSLLVNGVNSIAVEVHQSSAASSDISFDAELITSTQTSPALPLDSAKNIKARTFDGANWSALEAASFSTAVPAAAGNLAVTEINYNPLAEPGTPAAPFNDKENFEFIELRNIGTNTIDLEGVRFTVGITFDFTGGNVRFLAPGESVLAVKNTQAFEHRYGGGLPVAGVYSGSLSNGGEQIKLVDANGDTIQDFTYDDDPATTPPWPVAADGGGYSLTVRDVAGNYNSSANWRASLMPNGTPGLDEFVPPENLALKGKTVSENAPFATVGTLSATDADVGDSVTFSIVPGGDGSQFVIVGKELRVGSTGLDFEAGATRSVTVRATDSHGLYADRAFTIDVTDVPENEAPQSAVAALPALTTATDISLSWSGSPDAVSYDIYVSEDGGPYALVPSATGTTALSATFTGAVGHTYRFYSIATDAEGYVEAAPAVADAVTTTVLAVGVQSISNVAPDPRSTVVFSRTVTFSRDIDPATLSSADFTLTRNGGPNLLTGQETINGSGNTFTIEGLSRLTRADGQYVLTVSAAGVLDLDGLPGAGSLSETWTMDGGPYVLSIAPVTPNVRETSVDSIDVTFSEEIDPATFTISNFKLTWNGGPNLVTGTESIANVSGNTWRISGLAGLTNADGRYWIYVNAGGVEDTNGTPGAGVVSTSWTLRRVGPAVTAISPVSPNPTNAAIDTLDVTFSEELDPSSVSVDDLVLRRNGAIVPIAGGASFTHVSGNLWRIAGLTASTGNEGAYSLTVDTHGIQDVSGIPGVKTRAVTWVADLTAPAVRSIARLTPNPRNTPVESIEFNFTEKVREATVDLGDLTLKRNGQVVPWTNSQSLVFVSGSTWRVVGLAGLTAEDGEYSLTIDPTGVVDVAGNSGQTSKSMPWTMDSLAPTSSVTPFGSPTATSLSIELSVTGSDPAPANGAAPSGVKYYDLYVSADGGSFVLWKTIAASATEAATKTTFRADGDHTYDFRSIARDAAGNVESKGDGVIEASITVPDLSAPATAVTQVDTSTSTFVVSMEGADVGSNGKVDSFTLYVSIDGAPAKKVAVVPGGSPGAGGTYSAATSFRAIADGQSHSYRFFSIGKDGLGRTESAPAAPNDVLVSASFPPDQVTAIDVEKGAVQRSLVRNLDVVFSRPDDVAAIVASISDGISGNDGLRLRRFNVNGANPVNIPLAGRLAASGNTINFDFGPTGMADGYYELGVDLDGDGTLDQFLHFHRLLGDFSGDGKVDSSDASLLTSALGQSGPGLPYDLNVSGLVDLADQNKLKTLLGRQLAAGLPVDD